MKNLSKIFTFKCVLNNASNVGYTRLGKVIKKVSQLLSEVDYNIKEKLETDAEIAVRQYIVFKDLIRKTDIKNEYELKSLCETLKQFLVYEYQGESESLIHNLFDVYTNERFSTDKLAV